MDRLTPGKSLIWLLGFCLLFPALCVGQENKYAEREWVDNTGSFRIMAEFIEVKDGKVRLRRIDNGKVIAVPLDRLSNKDRQFITDMNKPAEEEAMDTESVETPPKDPKPEETPPPKDTTPEETKTENPKPEETKPADPKPKETKPTEPKPKETKPEVPKPEDTKPEVPKPEDPKPEDPKPNETLTDRTGNSGTDPGETRTGPPRNPPTRTENSSQDSGGQFNPGGEEEMPAKPDASEPPAADNTNDQAKPLRESNVPKDVTESNLPKDVTESNVPERMPVQPKKLDPAPAAETTQPKTEDPPGLNQPELNSSESNSSESNSPEKAGNSSDNSIPSQVIPFRPKREPKKEKRDSEIPKFEPDEIVPENPDLIGMPEREEPESLEVTTSEAGLPQGEPYGRYLETDIHPIIDSTQVEEELVADRQPWTTMTNDQLVQMIQVSGNLSWKGKVNMLPTLEPILPNYELVIGARGAELLDSACNVGFVELETFVDEMDNEYEPVAHPPRMANPMTGWVHVRRGAGGRFAQGGVRPVFVNLEFPRPKPIPKRINLAKGTFKLRMATEYHQITVKNVPTNRGRIELPSLAEKGIAILITRPDPLTLVARIEGEPNNVFDVKMTAEENTLGESKLAVQDSSYFQFNFVSEIPQGLDLKIRLVTRDREVTLPFEFSNLPFTVDM